MKTMLDGKEENFGVSIPIVNFGNCFFYIMFSEKTYVCCGLKEKGNSMKSAHDAISLYLEMVTPNGVEGNPSCLAAPYRGTPTCLLQVLFLFSSVRECMRRRACPLPHWQLPTGYTHLLLCHIEFGADLQETNMREYARIFPFVLPPDNDVLDSN